MKIEIHHHHYEGGSTQKKTPRIILGLQAVLGMMWITMIILTLVGVPAIVHLGSQVIWVAIISYYANAFTNFGGATSAFSAIVSGEHNEQEVQQTDIDDIKTVVTNDSSK